MRYLFAVLVVINVVYFLWSYTHPPTPPTPAPAELPPDVKTLTLLREYKEAAEAISDSEAASDSDQPVGETGEDDATTVSDQAVAELNEQPAATVADEALTEANQEPSEPAAQEVCYTLGPFANPAEAQKWGEKIKASGFSVTQRAIEEQAESGYWIYLPPVDDPDVARALSKELAEKGVKDYFIVTTEDNKNAISLGLFSRESGAQRRMEEMSKLGYQPQIDIRYTDRTLYWLDYEETEDHELPPKLWQDIVVEGYTIQRVVRDCG